MQLHVLQHLLAHLSHTTLVAGRPLVPPLLHHLHVAIHIQNQVSETSSILLNGQIVQTVCVVRAELKEPLDLVFLLDVAEKLFTLHLCYSGFPPSHSQFNIVDRRWMSREEEVDKTGPPNQYIPSNGLHCSNLPYLHAYVLVFCLLDRP